VAATEMTDGSRYDVCGWGRPDVFGANFVFNAATS
jgi:hypothetical protein